MNKLILRVSVFASLFTVVLLSKAQGIEFQHGKTFQEILDMAQAQNKLVFMDCYTSWCGPCKRLSALVFPDSAVGAYFNEHFINVKFDMEKDEGLSIAARYGIRAYPTLLWLDGKGEVVHKVVGGLDPAGLIQNGQKAGDPAPGILNGMHQQYNKGNRDLNFLSDFLNAMNSAGENYSDVFKEYIEKLNAKDLQDPKHSKTLFSLTKDLKSPGIDYVLKNKEYLIKLLGAEAYNTKINQLATKAVDDAAKTNNAALFNEGLNLIKNNKADDAAEKVLTLSMDYYSRTNDWTNYDKSASAYIKKYAAKNPTVLNDVAWNYYLNVTDKALLTKASKWAYEALNIDNKYTYNLTYAYLLYKLDNLKEAEKACDYAIIRATEENLQPTSAQALKDAIKKTAEKK
jgi:thiol-disulfide isomerase/thioredoxin